MLHPSNARPRAISRGPKWALAALLGIWVSGCASYTPDYEAADTMPQTAVHFTLGESASVDELIEYAQHHHPQVTASRDAVKTASANRTQAAAWADPTLSVSQGLTDSGWQTIAIEQEIPVFQRRQIAMSQAESEWRAAKAQLLEQKAAVAEAVKQAVTEHLYTLERLNIQHDVIALLQQSVAVAQSRYESGDADMAELLRAQNSLDAAQTELHNLQTLTVSTMARVNSALGRDAREALPALPDLATVHAKHALLPADEDELYGLLDANSPTLMARRYALRAQVAAVDLAKRAGRPRFMLGLEYMNTDMGDGMPAAMASVSLPIWRSAYRAQREGAQAQLSASRAEWQSAQQDAQATLSMALYQWHQAGRDKTLYGEVLVNRSERAVASTLNNYQTGTAPFSDLVSSQQEWLSAALNYQRALADQINAAAQIEALTVLPSSFEVSHE